MANTGSSGGIDGVNLNLGEMPEAVFALFDRISPVVDWQRRFDYADSELLAADQTKIEQATNRRFNPTTIRDNLHSRACLLYLHDLANRCDEINAADAGFGENPPGTEHFEKCFWDTITQEQASGVRTNLLTLLIKTLAAEFRESGSENFGLLLKTYFGYIIRATSQEYLNKSPKKPLFGAKVFDATKDFPFLKGVVYEEGQVDEEALRAQFQNRHPKDLLTMLYFMRDLFTNCKDERNKIDAQEICYEIEDAISIICVNTLADVSPDQMGDFIMKFTHQLESMYKEASDNGINLAREVLVEMELQGPPNIIKRVKDRVAAMITGRGPQSGVGQSATQSSANTRGRDWLTQIATFSQITEIMLSGLRIFERRGH